jgi:acetylornithine deacetylase/succinyl-diaminopimelate desuccinylase-like protein
MRLLPSIAAALSLVSVTAGAADITASRQTAGSVQARTGEAEFRALYRELVEINTTLSVGSCTEAATAMKARLSAAGYPESQLHLVTPPDQPKGGNLIAILPGSDAKLKPVLLLAHIDVVEARREDWTRDPFKLVEDDGFFYARGSSDDKAMAAIFTDALVRYRKEGYRPKRGIKLALTCGEETPNHFNGVKFLVENHRDLIDAAFALNEGGGGRYDQKTGVYRFVAVQVGEKLYQDFKLTATDQGGHSSRPTPANPIYRMARALAKIDGYSFPIEFNDTTRVYFQRSGAIEGGTRGADMIAAGKTGDAAAVARLLGDLSFNGTLHTTCVATQIEGGHAPNALPQNVSANVNCRIFPGHDQKEILAALTAAVADPAVKIEFADTPETPGAPPALSKEVLAPIEALTSEMYPGVAVIPVMSSGATDGRFLTPAGIPTYGVSGMLSDGATSNAHGLNERIRVQTLIEGREFLYRLTKMYAGGR